MRKIIKLTESDLEKIVTRVLSEQTTAPKETTSMVYKPYLNFVKFSNEVRPKIEEMATKLFPANKMDKQFKNQLEYRNLKDKEDAYCHQLASAMASSMFGNNIASLIGLANEWYGGLRIFFKGNPGKNIPKFSTFSSGYSEDMGNNNLGVEIAKKYPNKNLEFYSNEVLKNIKNNNFYDSTAKKPVENKNNNIA
jgi:hypothetical protein